MLALFVTAGSLVGGCFAGALEGFSSGGPPPANADASNVGADAGPMGTDGAVTTDAQPVQDAAPDGPEDNQAGSLLVNGDFELGCAGWSSSFGSHTESS